MEMEPTPFIDLAAQQKRIYKGLMDRIESVLSHGKYIMGPEVAELEGKLARYIGAGHAISCSSGTDALLMALMAYDVGPGDAILTTPFTFMATAEVIALLGATPVFVDIDPGTFNLNPEKLSLAVQALRNGESAIYPLPKSKNIQSSDCPNQLNPKGIITVDLFGLPAEYESINTLAKANNLFVIEDGAQSFGAKYHGKKALGLADIGATSFFPAKPLGCYGDGGALFTDNNDLADRIRSIRLHGKGTEKYDNVRIGLNGRLDTLQASILLEKLEIYPSELEAKNNVAQRYSNRLNQYVDVPQVPDQCLSAWAQYSVKSANREEIRSKLNEAKIPTAVYYPKPLHLQPAFTHLGYGKGDFPVSEETSKTIFSLPMHPYLSDEQIDRITGIIKNAC